MEIKVFDISDTVDVIDIDQVQRDNINKIFDELTEETHLVTNCFLNLDSSYFEESPIYYFNNPVSDDEDVFRKIADDLLLAESKSDKTRNSTIREGLLFIKATNDKLFIVKLEKLNVIDMDTYETKSELGKERDYFKVCMFNGLYEDVKIIDKNKTAAKYWYEKFLGLDRKRTSEDNTNDIIDFVNNKALFQEEINELINYNEIKRFTEYYLFDNKKFDKSDLFNELILSGLITLENEEQLYSEKAKEIDSDFDISEKAINKKYKMKIQTSKSVTITTNNYIESIRDNEINFDKRNKKISIMIDDDYIERIKEELDFE